MAREVLVFDDLEPQQREFEYKGKTYILTEASADAAAKYRNASLRAAKMNDGKITGMDGLADAEPILVARCVFEAGENKELRLDGQGNANVQFLVPLPKVLGWPDKLVSRLYNEVKAMTPSLNNKDKGTADPKASPGGTDSTSSSPPGAGDSSTS